MKGLRYYPIIVRLAKFLLSINNKKVVLNSFVMHGVIIGNFVSYPCICITLLNVFILKNPSISICA